MAVSAGLKFAQYAEEINSGMRDEMYDRGVRVTKLLRNTELEILAGTRTGRKHKSLPNTSSAPGEAPAAQSGDLRAHWDDETIRQENGHVGIVISRIASTEQYAECLENGTKHMASRPFVDKIIEKAEPEILKIVREPYAPHL